MRRRGWKVPTVLLTAALVGACGGEAESAADSGSERVIPVAEEGEVPAGAALSEAPETPTASSEHPSEPTTERAAAGSETATDPRREPASASPAAPSTRAPTGPPTEVVRTDPEPSVALAEPMEVRPERPLPEPLAAPAGTHIALTVEEDLSTRVSATGDRFRATVAEDVLGADGVVLLPRGTPVRGRVIESFESPSSDRPATLALGVEAVELDGRLVPVMATVTELEHETEARDSGGRSAAKVGAGAVAGALLGKILGGDGEDAVKGAVAGALAGAAVAHATRDGHAVVPAGARVVVVLDERLVVEPVPLAAGR